MLGRGTRIVTTFALALMVVGAAPPSRAEEKLRLRYRAPSQCADEASFVVAVRSRLPSGWEAAPEELATTFDVEITSAGEHFTGTIRYLDARGAPFQRVVEGPSCLDVVNGMVLVTVLAIRSRVEDEPAPDRASPKPAQEPACAEVPSPTIAPSRPPPPPPPERSLHLRAGAVGYVTSGVGPEPAFGGGLSVGVEAWRARLGLALAGFGSGRVSAGGFPSEYQLLLARLDGCPLALGLAPHLELEPCALMEIGSLRAETFASPPGVTAAGSGSAVWVAPGLLARVVGRFGSVWFGVEGFARFPLFHERFYVDAGEPLTAFEVPALAVGAGLGLGLYL